MSGPRSASGVKLGRVLINCPVVSAFGQTGHRADMASGPSLTHLCHSTINLAVMHNERLTQLW